jgi:type IV secretion system protein VirB9
MTKTIRPLLLAILLATLGSAHALDAPDRSPYDGRIQKTAYNEQDVVLIKAVNGLATQIVFAKGEEVVDYGSGYTSAWEFKARGNNFYLKPKSVDASTNLFITTNRRTYSFDLRLVNDKSQVSYRVTFSYPDDVATAKRDESNKRTVADRLNTGIVKPDGEGGLQTVIGANYNYTMSVPTGSEDIMPVAAYDDNHFTVLRFKTNQDFPTVYRRTDSGEESLVNSHVEEGVLVIHGVYKQMVLRAGKSVVGVFNESFDGGGTPVKDGVSVPGVERQIKQEEGL